MRKRILFVGHTAKLGGGEIALLNLVQHLDRREFEPIVLLGADGTLRERLLRSDVETHVLPLAASVTNTRKDRLGGGSLLRLGAVWHAATYVFRLARAIRDLRADLVHANSLKADILGGIGARLAGVPVLWHVRDRIADDYLPPRVAKVFRWLCQWLPAFVVANSQATMDTLRLRRSTCAVVHDGLPVEAAEAPAPALGAPIIGLVGRIAEWKGQHIFIEAAAAVHRKFPHVRFLIIGSAMFGEDAYEARIRALADDLGLQGCVEFTGFRADIQPLIGSLTILAHASTTGEPFGQVVIEGMAAGKPVVATRGGGIPEIVVEGETGLLVPMGDAASMAEALSRLLYDPELATAMGRAGRKRLLAEFTIQHTARKIEAVYRQLLSIGSFNGSEDGSPSREARDPSSKPRALSVSVSSTAQTEGQS